MFTKLRNYMVIACYLKNYLKSIFLFFFYSCQHMIMFKLFVRIFLTVVLLLVTKLFLSSTSFESKINIHHHLRNCLVFLFRVNNFSVLFQIVYRTF